MTLHTLRDNIERALIAAKNEIRHLHGEDGVAAFQDALRIICAEFAKADADQSVEYRRLEMALEHIREIWAGSECGTPVYAQEAYAINLCKEMYQEAVDALAGRPRKIEDQIHPALKAAAEILERFANSKADRPKIEEWQACYAKLMLDANNALRNKTESEQRILARLQAEPTKEEIEAVATVLWAHQQSNDGYDVTSGLEVLSQDMQNFYHEQGRAAILAHRKLILEGL